MFLLILAAIVSGDTVKINTVNTGKMIQLLMGGAPQTFTVDAYGRMTWMDHPSTNEITLVIDDDSYGLRTSRTGAGFHGCNYNFDFYSDTEMYQNSGMGCTKVFEKAPGAIELINDMGKPVYPAFDIGWGFSSDSVLGWLGADQIAVYTSENPYLAAIGAKEGTEVEVGYFDQSNYKSCGKVKVGEALVKQLSECTETKVYHAMRKQGGYDDKCGCRYAYCESQLLDTASCCEYYRENSECDGIKEHSCFATCVGKKFKDRNHNGEDVCSVTICQDPLNWINIETGGCTREPSRKDECCDQKTCDFAEEAVASVVGGAARKCGAGKIWSRYRNMCVSASAAEEAVAVAIPISISSEDWAVYGFAVIGIGALAHMAYKKVVKKSRETTPIYQEV